MTSGDACGNLRTHRKFKESQRRKRLEIKRATKAAARARGEQVSSDDSTERRHKQMDPAKREQIEVALRARNMEIKNILDRSSSS